MPNTPCAAKRSRSDAKKRLHNQNIDSELKSLSKKLATFTTANLDEAKKLVASLVSKYDKAVKKGVIPRGRADRRKSRITSFVNTLSKPKA